MARKRRNNGGQGPSTSPSRTLSRTFRYMVNFQLNNTTGNGVDQYAYYSKYLKFDPTQAFGFNDACATFELWRMRRARVYIQPGYNSYNQTYNTVNLDSALSTTVWTAADYGNNENISGVDLFSYQNARFHSLSINSYKKIVDTRTRLNMQTDQPIGILPASTWLDTSLVNSSTDLKYSGFHLFTKMPGMSATSYLPKYQMILEVDIQFKQPAWQNMPSTYLRSIVGSKLECDLPDETVRNYLVEKVIFETGTQSIRLVREDGEPGSLTYTLQDFFEVYKTGKNVGYFSNLPCRYTGPIPLKGF